MLNIIITIDYEIFGNGKGDVRKHIIYPTNKILKICADYKVPVVIMFETDEYVKFREYDEALIKDLGYSPYQMIRNQIKTVLKNGHDVQLHIHPQWEDAEYKEGNWILKDPNAPITELSEERIQRLIKKGIEEINNISKCAQQDNNCVALRLTNMPWVEAPEKFLNSMINNGIKIHSLSNSNSPKNNNKGYWPLGKNGKIYEFPIQSMNVQAYKVFSFRRIIASINSLKYLSINYANVPQELKSEKKRKLKVSNFFKHYYDLKWDLCKLNANFMLKMLEEGLSRYDWENNEVPLVMIGHSKDFFNVKELKKFVKLTHERFVKKNAVRFSTFKEFVLKNLD